VQSGDSALNWSTGTFIALAGFMTGILMFGFLVRWLVLGYEAWSKASPGRALVLFACQSLFHSAPWLVVAAAIFAYHVHSEPWAQWLAWGFGAAVVVMTGVTAGALLQMARRKGPLR
jgi:hypothetical protein